MYTWNVDGIVDRLTGQRGIPDICRPIVPYGLSDVNDLYNCSLRYKAAVFGVQHYSNYNLVPLDIAHQLSQQRMAESSQSYGVAFIMFVR